jgi:hypothetical protein
MQVWNGCPYRKLSATPSPASLSESGQREKQKLGRDDEQFA